MMMKKISQSILNIKILNLFRSLIIALCCTTLVLLSTAPTFAQDTPPLPDFLYLTLPDAPSGGLYRYDSQANESVALVVPPDGRIVSYQVLGDQVLYDVHVSVGANIYQLDLNTGESEQLLACAEENTFCAGVRWFPDGTRFAYERYSTTASDFEPAQIWVYDLNTGESAPWTALSDLSLVYPATSGSVRIASDGRWLALFESQTPAIRIYDLASNAQHTLITALSNFQVGDFSADGQYFAYRSDDLSAVYAINLETLERQMMPAEGLVSPPQFASAYWHPIDPNRVFVIHTMSMGADPRSESYLLDLSDPSATVPIYEDVHYIDAVWSADGEWLVLSKNAPEFEIIAYHLSSGATLTLPTEGMMPYFLADNN